MSGSDFGKGLLAFVAGAAVGAALGILFAPAKGAKTRKKIVKKTRDFTDAASEKLQDLIDSAEEIVDELKENASKPFRKDKTVEESQVKKAK